MCLDRVTTHHCCCSNHYVPTTYTPQPKFFGVPIPRNPPDGMRISFKNITIEAENGRWARVE